MALVTDRTAECYDGKGKRNAYEALTRLVVHRCSLSRVDPPWNAVAIPDEQLTGPELARRFRRNPATGGAVPYHLLVLRNGNVEQLLPLLARGAHAKGANASSVAIAYAGYNPTPAQVRAIVRLALLLVVWRPPLAIVGHSQIPGSSADPGKVCPGEGCDLVSIRANVLSQLPNGWRQTTREQAEAELARAGLVV